MEKKIARYCYIAAGGLALIALFLWFAPAAVNLRRSEPLIHSFPLVPGQTGSYSFVVHYANKYYVGIALDRNLPFQRLTEILGWDGKKAVSRPTIQYRLSSNGRVVPTVSSTASWWGRTVGFYLASFVAVPDQRYTLEATVRQAEPDLQLLNPHLVVELAPLPAEDLYASAMLSKLVAGLLSILAVLLGCCGLLCCRG